MLSVILWDEEKDEKVQVWKTRGSLDFIPQVLFALTDLMHIFCFLFHIFLFPAALTSLGIT